MTTRTRTRALRPAARALVAAGGALTLGLGLGACSTSGSEEGASVEDVQEDSADVDEPATDYAYDGVYDSAFSDDQDSYVGEEVTLSADVNEVLSDSAFTIAGTGDTTVGEFLVVDSASTSGLEPELTVQATGTVMEAFDVVTVEEDLGVDLDDDLYSDWEGQNYLMATSVDTSVAGDS
ncbi:hypothetical protein [Pseudokineococcus sp. 1T1Z-3]|uniref:hypothetical protein n=1 Tax=Pseudokineococcus sp. 1T1Z-3 TaxID=3132745 RepID=UPI0030AA5CC2